MLHTNEQVKEKVIQKKKFSISSMPVSEEDGWAEFLGKKREIDKQSQVPRNLR